MGCPQLRTSGGARKLQGLSTLLGRSASTSICVPQHNLFKPNPGKTKKGATTIDLIKGVQVWQAWWDLGLQLCFLVLSGKQGWLDSRCGWSFLLLETGCGVGCGWSLLVSTGTGCGIGCDWLLTAIIMALAAMHTLLAGDSTQNGAGRLTAHAKEVCTARTLVDARRGLRELSFGP